VYSILIPPNIERFQVFNSCALDQSQDEETGHASIVMLSITVCARQKDKMYRVKNQRGRERKFLNHQR